MTFIFSMTISLPLIFIFMNHPLTLGLILLIQTLIISLLTGLMNYNFWFSYILFLIMVGGMLILFIYMTSIASNEKFKFSQTLLFFIVFVIFMSMTLLFMDPYIYSNPMMNYDLMNQNANYKNQFSLMKFMNWPNYLVMILMFNYLLITLIMVVKVTNIEYGPIRQKF